MSRHLAVHTWQIHSGGEAEGGGRWPAPQLGARQPNGLLSQQGYSCRPFLLHGVHNRNECPAMVAADVVATAAAAAAAAWPPVSPLEQIVLPSRPARALLAMSEA